MSAPAQIVVDQVNHLYRPPRGREVLALDQVSLEVANREFVALLGPSGCGKSTLLYLIGGFMPVETGAILSTARRLPDPAPTAASYSSISRCFPGKPCAATCSTGWNGRHAERRARKARDGFIDLVGLAGFEDSYPRSCPAA